MSFKKKKEDADFEMAEGERELRVINIKESEPVFNVADTLVLLHIAEIWNYRPKELFACRVPDYDHLPSNCLLRNAEKGWCGDGIYAIAPIWDWVTTFRQMLNIPKENMYAKVMGNGQPAVSTQVH
jgi:hypothetical protein